MSEKTNLYSEAHLTERHLSTEEIFQGRIMHIIRDTVALPDGKETTREVLRHRGAACVIPLTDEGEVLMVRQYRYPIGSVLTEIPAGKLDSADEDPLSAAKRELREETGATADIWLDLGVFYGAPAYTDEAVHMYAAKNLHFGAQQLDPGEFLDVCRVPLEELVAQTLNGEITDGKTQVAVLKLAALVQQKRF